MCQPNLMQIDPRWRSVIPQNFEAIMGWLEARGNRQWNLVAALNKRERKVALIEGPWQGGHWGHEAYVVIQDLDEVLYGIPFPAINLTQERANTLVDRIRIHTEE